MLSYTRRRLCCWLLVTSPGFGAENGFRKKAVLGSFVCELTFAVISVG